MVYGKQMRKSLKDRMTGYFINMGSKHKFLRIPAIMGLAVCLLFFRFTDYCRRGTKRFVCAIFIFMCFMVGNSFAYPVFQNTGGFVAGGTDEQIPVVSEDESLTLTGDTSVNIDDVPLLEDADVLDGYDASDFHGMSEVDKYSLSEILEESTEMEEEAEPADIPETENVEFKKVYFGYYDFSQGKKVEGIQSYLDEAIQEVNPSNCGKIYQYDAYLKLVNSLNGGSGDSDL